MIQISRPKLGNQPCCGRHRAALKNYTFIKFKNIIVGQLPDNFHPPEKTCLIIFQPQTLKISPGVNDPEEFLLYNLRIVHCSYMQLFHINFTGAFFCGFNWGIS